MTTARPRDDMLVSIGFAEANGEAAFELLAALAARLSAAFRYWELLIVTDVDKAGAYGRVVEAIPNVRLLKVRRGTSVYRRRVAIGGEAIGDVVAIAAIEDLPRLDLVAMIERAAESGAMVVGRRRSALLLNAPYRALGASAGFRVDASDMVTTAYARTVLNKLLNHPDPQLALRFPPIDDSITVLEQAALEGANVRRRPSLQHARRRLAMLQKLMVGSAPRVLGLVASLALLVGIVAIIFVVYAVVIWFVKEDVQPGWLTTSLALGLTALFLGCAIFGLSIGLQKLIDLLSGDLADDVVDEITAVDLFREVFDELNIEQDRTSAVDKPDANAA